MSTANCNGRLIYNHKNHMLSVLDSPLGGILYSLLMLLMLSTLSIWLHSRAGRAGLVRPTVLGLATLMGLRLLQLCIYLFAWLGWPWATAVAVPGERAVLVLSLAIVVWLWARPQAPTPRSQWIGSLPVLGAGILSILMVLYWLRVPAGSSFNYTDADYAWSAAAGLIALLGLLQILSSRKQGSGLGLVQVGLLLAGQVAHILLAEPFGNLPLLAQAAGLLAMPLLFGLPVLQPQVVDVPEIAEDLLEDTGPTTHAFIEDDALTPLDDSGGDQDEEELFQLGPELPSLEEMETQEPFIAPVAPAFFDEPESEPLNSEALESDFTEDLEPGNDLYALQQENARYRADVERLLAHIDALQNQSPATEQSAGEHEVLSALQQENLRLKQSLMDLRAAPSAPAAAPLAAPSITAEQAKEELRLALEEVAAVHTRLEAAQQAMAEAAAHAPEAKIPAEQVELVTSIAQELRQPLSSVMGYTDLLLGESVGLLGALQRKFLERVRSSTERMNALIDNLIRIAELDPEGQNVQRGLVDLGGVIDDAMSLLREAMQEKRIALRVNLPRQMPALNTDRDALQQILYHLLQNADAATPVGGAISLAAIFEEQEGLGEYVLIQVSDSGGGIPEEALPRVFSRVYRAQNPVISGVGDSGVGLTIAETLTKALGGRIWVESQARIGATFSVLLPLVTAPGAHS